MENNNQAIEEEKSIAFSGVQPSGNLHIGNYLGAIKNWLKIQEKYSSIFCVVDLHAITVQQDPKELQKKTIEIAKIYLASEIDPKSSTIFVQSHIPQHTELMWLLNTIVTIPELQKMTQFKDKSNSHLKLSGVKAGLMNYPVLQAADILLYNTDIVPVGEDQLQHIELTRLIARRFNDKFGETFKLPNSKTQTVNMRIMGLDNPENKMSKSAPSKYNRIELLDSPDEIREKIKKAVTDGEQGITYTEERKGLKNLIDIYSGCTNFLPQKIVADYKGKGFKEFKEDLAEVLISHLKPFQKRFHEISDSEVKLILKESAQKLTPIAEEKIKEVKTKMGFYNLD